jgi:hypothetical protein
MNPKPERETFLTDVLSGNGGDCEMLLQTTLRHVRRRRRWRRAGPPALVAAGLMIALVWSLHPFGGSEKPAIAETKPPVTIIGTQPLPSDMVVETRLGLTPVVHSSGGYVAIIETGQIPRVWELIDDRQLLALLDGRPAMLVKRGPNEEELIFSIPADRETFVVP